MFEALLVDRIDVIQHAATRGAIHAVWIIQIQYGIADAAKLDALMDGRKKAASPETIIERLAAGTPAAS